MICKHSPLCNPLGPFVLLMVLELWWRPLHCVGKLLLGPIQKTWSRNIWFYVASTFSFLEVHMSNIHLSLTHIRIWVGGYDPQSTLQIHGNIEHARVELVSISNTHNQAEYHSMSRSMSLLSQSCRFEFIASQYLYVNIYCQIHYQYLIK